MKKILFLLIVAIISSCITSSAESETKSTIKKITLSINNRWIDSSFENDKLSINLSKTKIVTKIFTEVFSKGEVEVINNSNDPDILIMPSEILFVKNESKKPGLYNAGIDFFIHEKIITVVCSLSVEKEKPIKDDYVEAGLTCISHILASEIKRVLSNDNYFDERKLKAAIVGQIRYKDYKTKDYKVEYDFALDYPSKNTSM